jgi:Crp-like helix-turn-helix domain
VDLEGQLSNPDKALTALVTQGLEAKSGARQVSRTPQKRSAASARSRPSEELGHYSNPATEPTSRSRRAGVAPPAAPHPTQRRLRTADVDVDVDVDALVARYHAGETINELAGRFGINRTTVIAHLNRQAVPRRIIAEQWDHDTLTNAARLYTTADTRVLRRLLALAEQFGDNNGTVIPLTQDDLASMAGTTRPTANRVLKKAEADGVLRLSRGRMEILDTDQLARRAR